MFTFVSVTNAKNSLFVSRPQHLVLLVATDHYILWLVVCIAVSACVFMSSAAVHCTTVFQVCFYL